MVDHLTGRTKEPSEFETGLSTFGIGKELGQVGWRELLDQLLFEGLLLEDPNDGRPLVALGAAEAVKAVYRGERRVQVRKPATPHRAARPARQARGARSGGGETLQVQPKDQGLFEALRAWRRTEAQGQALPPYVIFHDRTLADIAMMRPRNLGELASCNGVGQGKLDRYGAAVLAIVRENEAAA